MKAGSGKKFSVEAKPQNIFNPIKTSIKTVGIIGSGPSGASLGSLLKMKGLDVTIFDDGRRPDLIVGESLIPAIVPVLRKLGLEERAAGRRSNPQARTPAPRFRRTIARTVSEMHPS